MKMNTPCGRSRPAVLFRIALCLVVTCALLRFGEASASNEQRTVKIRIGKLQHEIKMHLDKIDQSNEVELSILDDLDKINRKLTRRREKSSVLHKRLASQEELLPELKEKIEQIEDERDKLRQHILKRLRSFYMMGKIGTLNVTFSNKDLPELMLFSDSFQQLIIYDEKIITQYRTVLHELEQVNTSHELQKSLLDELLLQAKKEEKVLLNLRADQQQLLDTVKAEKRVHQLAVQEMRKAEEDLIEALMGLKLSENIHRRQGLLLGKGRLSSPVTGTVLLRFGDIVRTGLKKGENLSGITVAIEPDTPVHAVYKGEVAYADYKRGYGNVVIIDHGGNYFTVTSRLDTIIVNKGDEVQQDQEIGTSGDVATLYEPGVYFEIRHGSTALDPLEWLKIE
jgi:septal ring factor EnvC (AmiA/AmiB activator)